ncbi:MAG: tetratricopeptide repeat protein, partial [Okeania sp. SIO4D6]|nr:tetratricopeptide repeat protein [Okeania sp. SIO4D6]
MVSPKRWLSILSVNSLMLFNVSFPLLILPSIVNGAEVIAQTDKSAEAERLLRQGYELLKQGTAESKKQAIEISEKALQLYREAGNKTWEALTLLGIGRVYSDLGEKQKALDYFNQSLTLWQEVKDQTGEARTLTDIGGHRKSNRQNTSHR